MKTRTLDGAEISEVGLGAWQLGADWGAISDERAATILAAADAGILNFCFVLVGFPTETDTARENMTQYIIENRDIHTITISYSFFYFICSPFSPSVPCSTPKPRSRISRLSEV